MPTLNLLTIRLAGVTIFQIEFHLNEDGLSLKTSYAGLVWGLWLPRRLGLTLTVFARGLMSLRWQVMLLHSLDAM
jgi:hypothetical protein